MRPIRTAILERVGFHVMTISKIERRKATSDEQNSLLWSRLLKPGMTVLDVGAHHGLYSLLASMKVGPAGRFFI